MKTLLTTKSIKESEGRSFWSDLVCDVFVQLDVQPVVNESPFFGSIETSHLSNFQFSNVISHDQKVLRTKRQIAKSVDDYFLISFQLSGCGRISQDGRTAILKPGAWSVYDSTRPYELFFTHKFSQLVLQIPRTGLDNRLVLSEESTGRAISGNTGLGKLSRDIVLSAWQEADNIPPHATGRLLETITELLSTAINESSLKELTTTRSDLIKILEIKNYIKEQLQNPLLSVEMVADAFNISSRSLYYLFQKDDTSLSQFIRELRLEKCKKDLEDPQLKHRTITDIIFSWGFNSSSHFSYLFKKHYGISPRAYRHQIVSNSPK